MARGTQDVAIVVANPLESKGDGESGGGRGSKGAGPLGEALLDSRVEGSRLEAPLGKRKYEKTFLYRVRGIVAVVIISEVEGYKE